MTFHCLRKLFFALCGAACQFALSPQSAQADPKVTFVYRTLVDATPAGGAPDTLLTVTYSFRPGLRPSSYDSNGTSSELALYEPLAEVRIQLGDEAVEARRAGSIRVFNSISDWYGVSAWGDQGAVLGYDAVALDFIIQGPGMLDNVWLPVTPDFALQADFHYVEQILLLNSQTGETAVLSVNFPPPFDYVPFTLEQVPRR